MMISESSAVLWASFLWFMSLTLEGKSLLQSERAQMKMGVLVGRIKNEGLWRRKDVNMGIL